jgi:hypothetical protein
MNIKKQQIMFILFFVSLAFLSCQDVNSQSGEVTEKKESIMEKPEKKEKVLRHVVLFKFNDESSEEDVNKLNKAFIALPDAIPVIKDFEWGINDSPENFHQDLIQKKVEIPFTHLIHNTERLLLVCSHM